MAAFTQTGVELIAKGAGEFFGTMDKANSKIVGFGKTIGKAAVAGVAAFGAAAVGIGVASLNAAVDFETAFAGVIKTTDGLVDEMGNLTQAGEEIQQGFRDLAKEVPTAVEELLAIGELGGQLGIAQENLVDFTRTIAAMGEATNLSTEEAATGFAQIANVMGTPQDLIENMGSSIVALGNNFATTERDILSFGQRIAGAGQIVGLTEAQVFAIGAAFSSVGVQAEAGGTAVQKVLLGMNQAVLEGGDQLEIFAATAGLSAEDFAQAFEQDAGKAFQGFVEGLGLAGDDAINVLSALGLEDQRLIRSFLSLAGAGDLLGDTMDTATEAFADNTALTAEAEARYRTTAAQFDIFKNTIKDVAISIGQTLLPFLNKLLQAARPLIDRLGKELPNLLQGKVIPFIEKVAGAFSLLIKQFQGFGLKAFFGTFEDGSTILGGFFKRLGLGEEAAEKIAQVINSIAQFLMNSLIPAVKQVIQWLGQNLPIAFGFVIGFITNTVIPVFQQIVSWLAENIPVAIQTVSDFWTGVLQPALQAVWEFIQTNIIPIFQAISDWLAVAIPAAVTVLTEIWNSILLPAIQAIKPIVEEVIAFVIGVFEGLVAWVQENWPAIQATIQTVLSAVQQFIQNVLSVIEQLWNEHGARIIAFVMTAWENIKTQIQAAIAIVQAVISAVMALIAGDWDAAWAAIQEALLAAWEAIKSAINTALEAIKTIIPVAMSVIQVVISAAWNAIKSLTTAAWEFIKVGISNAIESIKGVLKGGMDVVRAVVKVAMEAVRNLFVNAWSKIKETFQSGIDKAKSIITNAKQAFLNAGKAVVDAIRQGIANAWDGLVGWFKGKLDGLRNMLPFSEPKDPASPLRGLAKAGQAIVDNLVTGMQSAISQLQSAQIGVAEAARGSVVGGITASPVAAGATTNNISVTNRFDSTINNNMDMTSFETRVLKIVGDAIEQFT